MFETGHKKFGGNKKGSKHKFSREGFLKALKKDAKTHNEDIHTYYIKKARENDAVLISLERKLLPDISQIQVDQEKEKIGYAAMTPAQQMAHMLESTVEHKPKEKP